jgi:hypothetical protein
MFNNIAVFSTAAALLLLSGVSAEAKIMCRDGFQIVNGQEISTPYCNDGLVGSVAREHGMKISDETVRNNPAAKNEVCRWVGSDIRIRHYCADADQGPDSNK